MPKLACLFSILLLTLMMSATAQAYTVKVSNDMQSDDPAITFKITSDGNGKYTHGTKNMVKPGEFGMGGWSGIYAGVCFKTISIKIFKELPGCDAGNLAKVWQDFKVGFGKGCRNIHAHVVRDGCSIKLNMETLK